MKIAVLGSGQVGQSLARGYARHGHDVVVGTRKSEVEGLPMGTAAPAVTDADLVVLGVAGRASVALAGSLSHLLEGKVLVDATNPLDFSTGAPRLFVGFEDSLGEQVQKAVPGARVVKAYNTVGNALFVDPELPGGPPTMFIAGNDDAAKGIVTQLLQETGWEVADLGGIEASRWLEAMCMAWVAYGARTGTWGHAFKLLGG